MNYKGCNVVAENGKIKIFNEHISREWKVINGLCYPVSLYVPSIDKEFMEKESKVPAPSPDFKIKVDCQNVEYKIYVDSESIVETKSLRLDVISKYNQFVIITHFKIYPDTPAISQWLSGKGNVPASNGCSFQDESKDNIEDRRLVAENTDEILGLCDVLTLDIKHKKLGITELCAHTDRRDNLCHCKEELLTVRSLGWYSSNLFYYHDRVTNNGLIFLKEAPLPYARPIKTEYDLVRNFGDMFFVGLGTKNLREYPSYPFTVIAYTGGAFGRIKALHNYQRQFRISNYDRDIAGWHSTWGDRNADLVVHHDFMMREIENMKEIGGDSISFTDGWHKGASLTGQTMERYLNQWNKPGFWEVDRDKFPDDLYPLLEKMEEYGLKKCLWYCPDRTHDYSNYAKDVNLLLEMYEKYGFVNVKIDAISFKTKLAEKNIKSFMHDFVEGTEGNGFVDLDITAGIRPDYFDCMQYGFLFLENRYKCWGNWYPHCTLRNLWQLSHFVDPRRLRMEFLNNEIWNESYQNDVLDPIKYSVEWLYVSVMFSNILMWFETVGLSDEYKRRLKNIIKICKPIRKEIVASNVYPIGKEPDGFEICGFISIDDKNSGYTAVFRMAGENDSETMEVPLDGGEYKFTLVSGVGTDFSANGKKITFTVPEKFAYSLYKFEKIDI